MHVGTGISAQQGMISVSETKRNDMGQRLGNTGRGGGGGGVRQKLFFLSSKRHNYYGGMSVGIVI